MAAPTSIQKFYACLNNPTEPGKDVKALAEDAIHPDWRSIGSISSKGRDEFVGMCAFFGQK